VRLRLFLLEVQSFCSGFSSVSGAFTIPPLGTAFDIKRQKKARVVKPRLKIVYILRIAG
jgi:hypothetical protein